MVEITKYIPSDREAIRQICLETGFAGESITKVIDNTQLFLDLCTNYVFDGKSGETFVARDGEKPVGYLFVSQDKKAYDRIQQGYYLKRIAEELASLYRFTNRDRKYYMLYVISFFKGEYGFPCLNQYPATLHINVSPNYQGRGIGRMLFRVLFEFLKEKGCPGVQLQTTTLNLGAIKLFKSFGFETIAARSSTIYRKYGFTDAKNLLMGTKRGQSPFL